MHKHIAECFSERARPEKTYRFFLNYHSQDPERKRIHMQIRLIFILFYFFRLIFIFINILIFKNIMINQNISRNT